EMIMPGLRPDPGVKLAYLPSQVGVDLRIVARGADDHDAEQKGKRLAQHIESICGKYVYGHDEETLEAVVGRLLMEKFTNLSVAESCTGGALGAQITSVPGSSTWFMGGVIAYDNSIKVSALDIPRELIESYGAVSEQCASAMAEGCRKRFATNYALAITGIAGPDGGSDDKPVGTTFVALAGPEKTMVRKSNFGLSRPIVRARASQAALEMLRRDLLSIA
ncbi:MAG: nicotinamide-nucleotide amidohydrolase family protein, partial [Candidatus Zixiibacteriota bacterium]